MTKQSNSSEKKSLAAPCLKYRYSKALLNHSGPFLSCPVLSCPVLSFSDSCLHCAQGRHATAVLRDHRATATCYCTRSGRYGHYRAPSLFCFSLATALPSASYALKAPPNCTASRTPSHLLVNRSINNQSVDQFTNLPLPLTTRKRHLGVVLEMSPG